MKKKILLLLAAVLVLTSIFGGMYAFADEPTEEPEISFLGASLVLFIVRCYVFSPGMRVDLI